MTGRTLANLASIHSPILAIVFGFGLLPSQLPAADLSELPRKIARQPKYQSAQPEYCLLVFGPDAATRVWLVRDGQSLYVDRNGNGDLTDDGEPIAADGASSADDTSFWFSAGDLREETLTHRYLSVSAMGEDRRIRLQVQMPGHTGTGVGGRVEQSVYSDSLGVFRFADTPKAAPIVHFRGPLTITLCGRQQLTRDRTLDLFLGAGTPGLGTGATAYVAYDNLFPRDFQPVVEISYPVAVDGEKPIRKFYELKQRC